MGTRRLKDTFLGSFPACLLIREMPSIELKEQRSRWESKSGLFLLRSMTEIGVIVALSSKLVFMGCRIYSLKTSRGWRFLVACVLLRFLKTSFWADLSISLCEWASESFCFRISFTLLFITSWESSTRLSFRSCTSLMVSVRVEFALASSCLWKLMREVCVDKEF